MDKNAKTVLIIGGIILTIVVILPTVIGLVSGWQYGGWGMMGGFGWMGIMPVLWIVVLGLVIWGVVALVRGQDRPSGSDTFRGDSALEVLKRRYARGEISKEEYEEKKKDLA